MNSILWLMLSFSFSAFGINTPLFYLAHQITVDQLSDKVLMLQIYLGMAWILGCSIFGLLVVKNSVECRIARQYLCQTAMFMCGLAMLALTTIDGNYQAYLLFVWIYGEIDEDICWIASTALTFFKVFLLVVTITRLRCSRSRKFVRGTSLVLGVLFNSHK